MSWQSKLLLVLMAGLLSGCGFKPLYAKKAPADVSKVFAGVKIESIPGRSGQLFKAELEDQLNPRGDIPSKPAFRLSVNFTYKVIPIGVARDGTVSRYNVYLRSHYILYRIADDLPVTSGDIGFVNSYGNLTNAYFSTYISEQDAIKRGIIELSQLYRQRLATYLEEGAPVQEIRLDSNPGIMPIPISPTQGAPMMRDSTPYP
jgi:LPS-assembly lipoprotein